MVYSAAKLITKSYYLSGKVARDFQTPSGSDMADGLDLLNSLLSAKTADQRLIPYFKEYDLSAVIGQESYFIPGLLWIDSFTFNNNTVRYPVMKLSRRQYFSVGRVDGTQSLPGYWHAERCKGGSNLFVYFLPNQNYPFKIWGKFGLDDVTMDEDLELTYEQFYIDYLRYALADYICAENNIMLQPQAQAKLKELQSLITDISPLDLTQNKISTLTDDRGFSWGYVNFSGGWLPPS